MTGLGILLCGCSVSVFVNQKAEGKESFGKSKDGFKIDID